MSGVAQPYLEDDDGYLLSVSIAIYYISIGMGVLSNLYGL